MSRPAGYVVGYSSTLAIRNVRDAISDVACDIASAFSTASPTA